MQCELQLGAVPCSALPFFDLWQHVSRVWATLGAAAVLWPIRPHLPLGYEFSRMLKVLRVSTDSGLALGTSRC